MSTAVLSTVPDINLLPPEVLDIIFSYVYPLFRIRVLSRVSKRWRSKILRSITKPLRYHEERALIYSHLTTLTLFEDVWRDPPNTRHAGMLPEFTALRKLKLMHSADQPNGRSCYCLRALNLTSLTSLTIVVGPCKGNGCVEIARRNRTSLRTLKLIAWDANVQPAEEILQHSYPSLTQLQYDGGGQTDDIALPFIAAHASQLQQIDIASYLQTPVSSFPSLHTLRVAGETIDLKLAADFAKLRSVELRLTRIPEPIAERVVSTLAPVLTRLWVERLLSPPAMQALAKCTALKQLDLPVYGSVPVQAASSLKGIGRCPNNPAILRSYANLTRLMIDLEHLSAYIQLEQLPVLPSLTDLSLQMMLASTDPTELQSHRPEKGDTTPADVFFPFLYRVMVSCPRLNTLTLTGWSMKAAAPLITAFFRQLLNSAQFPPSLRTLIIFFDGSWKERGCFNELLTLSLWLEVRVRLKWPYSNEPREEEINPTPVPLFQAPLASHSLFQLNIPTAAAAFTQPAANPFAPTVSTLAPLALPPTESSGWLPTTDELHDNSGPSQRKPARGRRRP